MKNKEERKEFNNFTLSDEEITKIINDFTSIIKSASIINGIFDEDLSQEIKIAIYKTLSRNRADRQKVKKKK